MSRANAPFTSAKMAAGTASSLPPKPLEPLSPAHPHPVSSTNGFSREARNMHITITQNTTACLRDVWQWGGADVHNVCDGAVARVPWGFWDWVGVSTLLAATFIVVLFVVGLVLVGGRE